MSAAIQNTFTLEANSMNPDQTAPKAWVHIGLIRGLPKYIKRCKSRPSADPEGGTGGPDPPPGKSQVISMVSIGNKQLDPPRKSWTPPGKCWTPSGTLKNDRFL